MNIILKPFSLLLTLFYDLTGSYGWSVMLFALVVSAIMFPFRLKSKKSMVKTSMLQGKLNRLQKMYGNNREKLMEEQQKLYEKEGVNPMSGCLWSLLPMVIIIPLYAIIRQPLQYMMDLGADQLILIARTLNWDTEAVRLGWTTAEAVQRAVQAAQESGSAYVSSFTAGGDNELYLASLINSSNLAAVQQAVSGAGNIFPINFSFFGVNLAMVPQLKFWAAGISWGSVGLALLPVISVGISLLMTFVTTKTNAMSNPEAAKGGQQMNWMMYVMMPIMYLWFGFSMPGGISVYIIANGLLGMVTEVISAQLLKKDYAAAAEARAKQELLDKEEEKRRKAALAAERARRAEEKKKQKGKKKEKPADEPKADASASRVGIRAYARGRAYDPDRFGGVTPYKDPNAVIDEAAVEKAREAKAERAAQAAEEREIEAAVNAQVEREMAELKDAPADAPQAGDAPGVPQADTPEALDEAWAQVTDAGDTSGDAPAGDKKD